MFPLPPNLACHFRDGTGQVDYLRLLGTPDVRLVELVRQLPQEEWVDLYTRLRQYQPGFLERMAASAAGIEIEAQRRRFLRVLEQAAKLVAV